MRNSLSKMQYLLFALLLLAMTGCGANKVGTTSTANGAGSITSKLVWGGKTAGKTVGAATVPSNVTTLKMTVTGIDKSGKPIPVVRSNAAVTPGAAAATTTISGIYPGVVTLAVQALDSTGAVQYEGYALRLVIVDGKTNQDAVNNPISMAAPLTKAQDMACVNCHETTLDVTGQNLVAEFKQSKHYFSGYSSADTAKFGATKVGCAGCHGPNHNDLNPAASGRCAECHSSINGNHAAYTAGNICSDCHNSHNTLGSKGCLGCHSFNQDFTAKGNYVNDNNGVRAVSGEFQKNAHHVFRASGIVTNADCAACHMEGNKDGSINMAYHMKDDKIHLRNGGGVAEYTGVEFIWNPNSATPDHNAMDKFCMSCHNANGAPSVAAMFNDGRPAGNPFNDDLTNGYDQMIRPAVVAVYEQFDTGNASHHAVRGKRYSGRTRVAGQTRAVTTPATFAQYSSAPFDGIGYSNDGGQSYPAGLSGAGKRKTIFDAGLFTTTYTTLAGQSLGDDSTLHCGDCHTVGQWTNTGTNLNKAAIGAHGSANEYLLRNSAGTDELHIANGTGNFATSYDITTVASLVCYNCHVYSAYGAAGKHEGVNGGGDCNDDKWTFGSAGKVGSARFNRSGNQSAWGTTSGAGGNIFGIQCANCHNAGPDAQFGGIHGGNITYTDGTGTDQKPYRFLPGLGNVKYAPNNHQRNDGVKTFAYKFGNNSTAYKALVDSNKGTNTPEIVNTWEEQTIYTGSRATCYTLNDGASAPAKGLKNSAGQTVLGTWGACTDHGGSSAAGGHGGPRNLQRSLTY